MVIFDRLVRFEDLQGKIRYGEARDEPWDRDLTGRSLRVYDGESPWDPCFRLSDETATVAQVLCPLPSVPIIHGIGLNYRKHAEEAGHPLPPHPVIFTKYPDTLAGPYEDIPISKQVQQLDYEGELSVVIGKDAKNIPENEDPLDYVLGYTVGNDVSSRYWQRLERGSGQPGYAKSFDKFAPLGPTIVSPNLIPDPKTLTLKTYVNGELRQQTGTDDLIFDIPTLIRHLSRGMTLRKGSVIMTGTPSGVAAFIKPPAWLKDRDIVEIEISVIGRIRNRMAFEV